MEKVHTYRDHSITLEAEMRKSGWICKWLVTPLDAQDTRSHSDYSTANFSTEEEAELAALESAQRWLDHSSPS